MYEIRNKAHYVCIEFEINFKFYNSKLHFFFKIYISPFSFCPPRRVSQHYAPCSQCRLYLTLQRTELQLQRNDEEIRKGQR